ncbi:glycosyltransferase involved in cell wall biosynthesis [Scopulibacillus darangshiensis]|uniref:Glycosyltransferase involved in cell wall biosynthesis n=1 Tax=Scopulibacillus darangshiensis TaxID=442528 RepID=A0A4R2NTN8_9BACL|nr:glycosyltransferase family 4 protein [Scopulibacillus darangshiensis]TCP24921.1 glycosyltransferase involved in cell wall biosynthesis [Scopulibacillus darangshiensis]
MQKNIWIWNHYATNMYKDQAGRHYWFAENLIKRGYSPTIFCASTVHNSNENIDTKNNKFITDTLNNIPFVFVETPSYLNNGKQRVKNMITFYNKLFPVAKDYAEIYGKPDVILASSVHPLTLVAGIKIAKKFNIPCICEVRDLWPESIVAYGALRRSSVIAKVLYQGEKWIYRKADSVIMTWAGGKDYIINQGWERKIDLTKVKHISNGVVISTFDNNSEDYNISDSDLDNKGYKNVVYTGSIRKVNNLGLLLDAAKIIQYQGRKDIRFLIYGDGDESNVLKKRCEEENIKNIIFKGRVEKKYVPSILTRAYINILHNSSTSLDKYGQSQNKFFEYLAAGKAIVQTYSTGYSICEKFDCGISAPVQNAEEIAKAVITACSNESRNNLMGKNARKAAYEFDFNRLTKKLINIIECVNERGEASIELVRKNS